MNRGSGAQMTGHRQIRVFLNISADEFLAYYEGRARTILVKSVEGLRVSFPASVLQRFVTHDGVHGAFVFTIDRDSRLLGIRKLN